MARLIISPLAEQDMEAIGDYIAQDNPRRAASFIAELRRHCAKIAASPMTCRLRTELGENIRSSAYGNYVIFVQSTPGETRIVRVLHSAMDIESRVK